MAGWTEPVAVLPYGRQRMVRALEYMAERKKFEALKWGDDASATVHTTEKRNLKDYIVFCCTS